MTKAAQAAAFFAHRPKGVFILKTLGPPAPVARQAIVNTSIRAAVQARAPRGVAIKKTLGAPPPIGKFVVPKGAFAAQEASKRYHKPFIYKPIVLGLIKYAPAVVVAPVAKLNIITFAARMAARARYLQRFPAHVTKPIINPKGFAAKPYLPRVPGMNDRDFDNRFRRFTELLSIMINSFVTSGQVVQKGANEFVITTSGMSGSGLTGVFP